jgi:protein-tyrosine sulfotransferase
MPANSPIIILATPYVGAEMVSDHLSTISSVACTSRTGVVPMCEVLSLTWQRVERRGPGLSQLAVSSIRNLADVMIGVVLAESGGQRWCEAAICGAGPARTFLKIFPETQFICVYRRCDGVISEVLDNNVNGLGGTEFWPYASATQGNNVAMVAAHWADHVESLLDFEAFHLRSCLRIRREDLVSGMDEELEKVSSFLGLSAPCTAVADQPSPSTLDAGPPRRWSLDRMPAELLSRVNKLHSLLGYESL